ncbi:hypothetical protein XB05_20250 [Xanthomonas arboricola]|nr:hypothetical protein XB05_20250 [Xanthomonas arboricola]
MLIGQTRGPDHAGACGMDCDPTRNACAAAHTFRTHRNWSGYRGLVSDWSCDNDARHAPK